MLNKFLAIIIALAWIFGVTFSYYIVHKPFGLENAVALLNVLGDLMAAGVILALGAAFGRRLLRSFEFGSPLEALVFQIGVGLGFLALGILLVGLLTVNRILFGFLFLAALFVFRNDLRDVWRDLVSIRLLIPSRFERALAVFIVLGLGVAGILALTPPIAWDAQAYHLVIPKLALERGQIAAPPDVVYYNFPLLGEMLFLGAMLLKSDVAAQIVHFSFLLLTLGAVFAFALRFFHPRIAWVACAVLVAIPSLLLDAMWAYVDVTLTFYTFAAFFALMCALRAKDSRWFALAGALAGFAISVKYTAAIVPVSLIGIVLLRRSWVPKNILAFAVSCGLVSAPYYLRTWVFTGNPFYPFVFGGTFWDTFRAQWFARSGSGLLGSPIQLLLAPWNATVLGGEGAAGYEATIGPFLLMLIPLLFIALLPRTGPELQEAKPTSTDVAVGPNAEENHVDNGLEFKGLVLLSLALFLFWLWGIASSVLLLQTRLLFPAFPAFALLSALGLEGLGSLDLPVFSFQRFTRLVMLLVLGLTGLSYILGFSSDHALEYLTGAESRDAYLANHLGDYYKAVTFVNTNLPKNARVLFLWEPRNYYASRSTQPDAILDAWTHLCWQYKDADSIAATLRAQGYTHILVNRAGLDLMLQTGSDPISIRDTQTLEELSARYLRPVYGKTQLQIETRDGRPGVVAASSEPYAVYELSGAGQ